MGEGLRDWKIRSIQNYLTEKEKVKCQRIAVVVHVEGNTIAVCGLPLRRWRPQRYKPSTPMDVIVLRVKISASDKRLHRGSWIGYKKIKVIMFWCGQPAGKNYKEDRMANVTHVRWHGYLYGVNFSEAAQALLREKAALYGVTPQQIADDACVNASCPKAETIEEYVRSFL